MVKQGGGEGEIMKKLATSPTCLQGRVAASPTKGTLELDHFNFEANQHFDQVQSENQKDHKTRKGDRRAGSYKPRSLPLRSFLRSMLRV